MGTIDEESATKFINALIKSVQTLCHGYLDFDTGIEIIGHINLSVDKGGSFDYILKEKVCRNDENSTLFISNSFHAQPKSEQTVKPKNSQLDTHMVQRRQSSDSSESGKLTSAISSISTALSSAKDSGVANSGSRPQQSTAKRKAHEDLSGDHRSAKSISHDSHFLSSHSRSSPHDTRSSSPLDSKASLSAVTATYEGSPRTSTNDDVLGSATILPQTANVTSDNQNDLDVNLAGSVLERVDDQSNSEMPEKDDSDLDLEVTFIKEEFVESERSACEFQGSGGGQRYSRGSHQRASTSSDGMGEQPLFPVALHSNASATYVPGGQDMVGLAQHYPGGVQPGSLGPSASQPQPGPSGMRDVVWADEHNGQQPNTFPVSHVQNCVSHSLGNTLLDSQKKYFCKACKYSVARLDNFKRHMRRHTGQKFSCDVCGARYICKYALQKHKEHKHGAGHC